VAVAPAFTPPLAIDARSAALSVGATTWPAEAFEVLMDHAGEYSMGTAAVRTAADLGELPAVRPAADLGELPAVRPAAPDLSS
jgi:hypothetical protein